MREAAKIRLNGLFDYKSHGEPLNLNLLIIESAIKHVLWSRTQFKGFLVSRVFGVGLRLKKSCNLNIWYKPYRHMFVSLCGPTTKKYPYQEIVLPMLETHNQILLENQEPKIFLMHEKHISTTNLGTIHFIIKPHIFMINSHSQPTLTYTFQHYFFSPLASTLCLKRMWEDMLLRSAGVWKRHRKYWTTVFSPETSRKCTL